MLWTYILDIYIYLHIQKITKYLCGPQNVNKDASMDKKKSHNINNHYYGLSHFRRRLISSFIISLCDNSHRLCLCFISYLADVTLVATIQPDAAPVRYWHYSSSNTATTSTRLSTTAGCSNYATNTQNCNNEKLIRLTTNNLFTLGLYCKPKIHYLTQF